MSIEKYECSYCHKEVWGKFLTMKGKEPWHTFCVQKHKRTFMKYKMYGGMSQ